MTPDFPFRLLRPDAPRSEAFSVAEVPHRAKLDQNESPLDVADEVKAAVLAELEREEWNRYPQPARYREAKARFGAAVGQPPERLILTAGADQLILLAYFAAGGRGRRARLFEPTYPMFAAHARTTQTELDRVVLGPDYDVGAHGLGDAVDLLVLVSPNNPTGNGPDRELVLEALARPCLVFLDEAYVDYSGSSVVDQVDAHPNLLVARSLSKSLLAGVRLGYAVGHPELVNVLEQLVFAPYHLSLWQIAVAACYGRLKPRVTEAVGTVVAERRRLERRLGEMGIRHWPSRANFVLFEVGDAAEANRRLLERGVRVRDVSGLPGLGEHLRVSVGAREENDRFLAALAVDPHPGAA